MITLWGEGRGFRVAWMLEEMGLPYRLRPVDMLAGVENDPEFLAVNPGGFIPALEDDGMVMVESTAILQYLATKYGPTDLAVEPQEADYGAYLQWLVMGEAGLMGPCFFAHFGQLFGTLPGQPDWTAQQAMGIFEGRRKLVVAALEAGPYLAGGRFTAADISVAYALQWARRTKATTLTAGETDFVARMTDRPGYRRALEVCEGTKGWAESTGE